MIKAKIAPKPKKPREKGALKADFWMLGRIWHYAPWYVITNVLYGIMMGALPAVGLLYTEHLYDGIEGGTAFGKLLSLHGKNEFVKEFGVVIVGKVGL